MPHATGLASDLARNQDALVRVAAKLALTAHEEQRTAKPLGRFIQREIVSFQLCRCDGPPRIVYAVLGCGHRLVYMRTRPPGSKRTAGLCYQCGAIQRTAAERDREAARMRARIGNVASSLEKTDALAALLDLVLDVLATPPVTDAHRALWERIERNVNILDLRNRPSREDE